MENVVYLPVSAVRDDKESAVNWSANTLASAWQRRNAPRRGCECLMGDTPNSQIDNRLVTRFYGDAQAYCELIDQLRRGTLERPFSQLLQRLSCLASSGCELPFAFPEIEVPVIDRVGHEQWRVIAGEIAQAVAPALDELYALHSESESALIRASMLWDDLADIYRDLQQGIAHYETGESNHIAEAIWQWRWGYEHHWGEHLFRAMITLHEIRYCLYLE